MSHKLGDIVVLETPADVGPDTGPATLPPDTWVYHFPLDPDATFVMLHLVGAALGAGDKVEIELGYTTAVYDASWGADYWAPPARGDAPVTVRYVRSGGGGGHVTIDRYGRGEQLQLGGADASAGGNSNGDVFMISSHYDEPAAHYYGGTFPPGSAPTWEQVASLPAGVMKDTARSVGMYIHEHHGMLTSCTATLVDADVVITAGHCVDNEEEVRSGSITFDFETDDAGNRPPGYNPRFYKMRRLVRQGYHRPPGDTRPPLDYAFIQIDTPPGGLGIPIAPLRPDVPPLGEPLFIIHHPRGSAKKVSRRPADAGCEVGPGSDGSQIFFQCDVDNGSSGSSIFDSAGRIVANLSWWTWGVSTLAVAHDLTTEPPPPRDVDVVLVLDRSGSMSLPGLAAGDTKMTEARQAAALFVSLLRTTATHRVGLVSFSTTSSVDLALAPANNATKLALIGNPPPAPGSIVGGLEADGMTTIGGGLQTALGLYPPPGPATNARAFLLLTDGLHNTPPSIESVEPALGGAHLSLNIVGLGTEASLDGPGLTRLARAHNGLYTRAGEGLALKKFFALAFGRIFDFPTSLDPEFFLPEGVTPAPPLDVHVCGESALTVVLGWLHPGAHLQVNVESPGGETITAATPGVVAARGGTWAHLRLPLPFGGQRDGTWRVVVRRPGGGGEFPPPAPATRYFVTALVDGGPIMRPWPMPPLYTGDPINPRVEVWEPAGGVEATVEVEVEIPQVGTGNVLVEQGMGPAGALDGDALDARAARLIELEQSLGAPLVPATRRTFALYDDGQHEDGGTEEDGVFGNPLAGLARTEGHYAFHARASYGHTCEGRREVTWTAYVNVGIDPDHTPLTTEPLGTLPDGRERVRLTFTPRDRYGNYLGPGRGGSIEVDGAPGSDTTGGLVDRGDGSYVQEVAWDPGAAGPPGLSIRQPGRTPAVIVGRDEERFRYVVPFVCARQDADDCACAPVRPGAYATEINIYNPHEHEVRVRTSIVPVVAAGAAAGGEPRSAGRTAGYRTRLAPHSGTSSDCCRLIERVLGAEVRGQGPVWSGIVDIASPVEVEVTAVYTATGPAGGRVSIDVEQIHALVDKVDVFGAGERGDLGDGLTIDVHGPPDGGSGREPRRGQ